MEVNLIISFYIIKFILTYLENGAWRSLEAHLNGVQGVAGSNPVAPTKGFSTLRFGTFSLIGKCDSFVTVGILRSG